MTIGAVTVNGRSLSELFPPTLQEDELPSSLNAYLLDNLPESMSLALNSLTKKLQIPLAFFETNGFLEKFGWIPEDNMVKIRFYF